MAGCPFLAAKKLARHAASCLVDDQKSEGSTGHETATPDDTARGPPAGTSSPVLPQSVAHVLGGNEATDETLESTAQQVPSRCPVAASASGPLPVGQCPLGFSSGRSRVSVGELDCLLCFALLHLPARCLPCTHVFCRDCLAPLRDCPACGADIEAVQLDAAKGQAVDDFIRAHVLRRVAAAAHGEPATSAPRTSEAPGATGGESASATEVAALPAAAEAASEASAGAGASAAPNGSAAATAAAVGSGVPSSRQPGQAGAALPPPLLPASSPDASAFLFHQAMRALRRGNRSSAMARLALCVSELEREQMELLLHLTHTAAPASAVHKTRGNACPYAARVAVLSKDAEAGTQQACGGAGECAGSATVREQRPPEGESGRRGGSPCLGSAPVSSRDGSERSQGLGNGLLPADACEPLMALLRQQLRAEAAAPRGLGGSAPSSDSPSALERLMDVVTRLGAALGSQADCCAMFGDAEAAAYGYTEAIRHLESLAMAAGPVSQRGTNASLEPQLKEDGYRLNPGLGSGANTAELFQTLTVSLNKLGDLFFREAKMDQALEFYQRALLLRQQALDNTLKSTATVVDAQALESATGTALESAALDVSISLAKVADARLEMGLVEEALQGFTRALALAQCPPSSEALRACLEGKNIPCAVAKASDPSSSALAPPCLSPGVSYDSTSVACPGQAAGVPTPAAGAPSRPTKRGQVIAMLSTRVQELKAS